MCDRHTRVTLTTFEGHVIFQGIAAGMNEYIFRVTQGEFLGIHEACAGCSHTFDKSIEEVDGLGPGNAGPAT